MPVATTTAGADRSPADVVTRQPSPTGSILLTSTPNSGRMPKRCA